MSKIDEIVSEYFPSRLTVKAFTKAEFRAALVRAAELPAGMDAYMLFDSDGDQIYDCISRSEKGAWKAGMYAMNVLTDDLKARGFTCRAIRVIELPAPPTEQKGNDDE